MANKLTNNFVTKSIAKMYLNPDVADVKFLLNGETVPAHKNILATSSSIFKTIFFESIKENDVVEIENVNVGAFKEFLQFFYLNEVTLTMENIEEVTRLADMYNVLDYLNVCAAFLECQLNADTMFWGYQLAISLNNAKLKSFCETQISISPLKMFESEPFLRCNQNTLKHILAIDSLNCNEIDIFKACLAWAKSTCTRNGLDENKSDHIKSQLDDCFALIRFGVIPTEEFATYISNECYKDLFTRDELADILFMRTVKDFKSSKFNQKPRSNVWWNLKIKLVCDREIQCYRREKIIQNKESTWFCANVRVLLGEIQCVSIDFYNSAINCIVNISEVNSQTRALIKTLLIQHATVEREATKIVLTRPIIIEAGKMYEICFDFKRNADSSRCRSAINAQVKVDDELTITFHENPNSSDDTSLILKMFFSRF